jgi:hypothetical protein
LPRPAASTVTRSPLGGGTPTSASGPSRELTESDYDLDPAAKIPPEPDAEIVERASSGVFEASGACILLVSDARKAGIVPSAAGGG